MRTKLHCSEVLAKRALTLCPVGYKQSLQTVFNYVSCTVGRLREEVTRTRALLLFFSECKQIAVRPRKDPAVDAMICKSSFDRLQSLSTIERRCGSNGWKIWKTSILSLCQACPTEIVDQFGQSPAESLTPRRVQQLNEESIQVPIRSLSGSY